MNLLKYSVGFLALLTSTLGHAVCYNELKARLPDKGIVLFGELHGTNEMPQFFLDCAKEFISHQEPVDIFLEINMNENSNLEKYLSGQINEAEFLNAPHWKKTDGRASVAMLSLIRALKETKIQPRSIRGFDAPSADREHEMMLNLVAQRNKERYSLVLTGNLHAHFTPGVAWNADFISFAKYLVDNGEEVISLNARYTTGSAWNCSPTCGVVPIPPHKGMVEPIHQHTVVFDASDPDYSGYYSVGKLTASIPVHP